MPRPSWILQLAFVCSNVTAWQKGLTIGPSRAYRGRYNTANLWTGGRGSLSQASHETSRFQALSPVRSTAADAGGAIVGPAEERGDSRFAGAVRVIYDEFFLKHRPPPGYPHPECPARVSTVRAELDGMEGVHWAAPSSLESEEAKAATLAVMDKVHKKEYLDEIRRICAKGGGAADFDTYVCPDTFEVCVAASSAWMDAAASALSGSPAFALTRPPGHHASAGVAMGFCIVCFAAVAAFHAVDNLGCERVAMLDFDVHHGNGVAALVKGDERIRYCSIHQGGIFPGSGGADDAGPVGNLKHLPFYGAGETWDTYEEHFETAVTWLKDFDPELVIVSAGYDALEADELATASLQPEDYGRMGKRLKKMFGARVAFGLEGGYNLEVTPRAVRETLKAFLAACD